MKYLQGIIVKLSECNKALKGNKLYVLQCCCHKEGNWRDNFGEHYYFPEVGVRCRECGYYPWGNTNKGQRNLKEDKFIPRSVK